MSDREVPKPEQPPAAFYVVRHRDPSGISGTGFVAQGTQWSDGGCAVYWPSETPCTQVWSSVEDFLKVHGHEGETTIEWVHDSGTELVRPSLVECEA